jgi:hypothetical protein
MSRFSVFGWLKALAGPAGPSRTKRRPAAGRRPARFVPRARALEDRWLPRTLAVTSAADNGGPGTLRAVSAGASPGSNIDFAPLRRPDDPADPGPAEHYRGHGHRGAGRADLGRQREQRQPGLQRRQQRDGDHRRADHRERQRLKRHGSLATRRRPWAEKPHKPRLGCGLRAWPPLLPLLRPSSYTRARTRVFHAGVFLARHQRRMASIIGNIGVVCRGGNLLATEAPVLYRLPGRPSLRSSGLDKSYEHTSCRNLEKREVPHGR